MQVQDRRNRNISRDRNQEHNPTIHNKDLIIKWRKEMLQQMTTPLFKDG
jgi:hypothetical protein